MMPETVEKQQFVTVAEAARITGRSASWFYTRIAIGEFARRVDDRGRTVVPCPTAPKDVFRRARRGSHLVLVVDNT